MTSAPTMELMPPSEPQPPPPAGAARIPVRPTLGADFVAADAVRASFVERHPLWILWLITLGGGCLRFFRLGSPSLWGDESLTYARVVGTYQQLLDQLITDGFGPLHYSFYWWLNSDRHLSPGVLKWLVIGVAGTVLLAVLSLAFRRSSSAVRARDRAAVIREVTTLTGAVVCLIAAGILGVCWVSRVYQPWLAADTPMTPLLMRLLPAAAGTAMVPAMYFLCRQFFGAKTALATALFTATSAYMLVYSRDAKMYEHFWLACVLFVACLLWWLRSRERGAYFCWLASGVAMVGLHKLGLMVYWLSVVFFLLAPRQYWLDLWKVPIVVFRAIAWPFLWAWHTDRFRAGTAMLEERDVFIPYLNRVRVSFHWPPVLFYVFGMGLIWATMYGPYGYYNQFNVFEERVATENTAFDPGQAGVGWVQAYNDTRTGPDMALMTATAFLYSWEWPRSVPPEKQMDRRTRERLDDAARIAPRTLLLLKGAGIALFSLLALGTLPWRKLFAGRRIRETALPDVENVYAPYRRMRVLWLAVWLTVPVYGIYCISFRDASTPWDMISAVATKTPTVVAWPKAEPLLGKPLEEKLPTFEGHWWNPVTVVPWAGRASAATIRVLATAQMTYYASIRAWAGGLTPSNLYWPAVASALFIGAGLGALMVWRPRITLRPSAQVLLAAAGVFVIGCIIHLAVKPGPGSVWMPRYVGVVWPPFAIVTAALLLRLPTRPVRWLAVTALVTVNLAQFSARVFAGSEPPTGRIMDDVWASNHAAGPFRAYFGQMRRQGMAAVEPGGGLLYTAPGRYYLSLHAGGIPEPSLFKFGGYEQRVGIRPREVSEADEIVRDLAASPALRTFVVWTAFDATITDQTENIGDALKGKWEKKSDEVIIVRDHWRWMDLYKVRRRAYQRILNDE